MILRHHIGKSIALATGPGEPPRWVYRYGDTLKPHLASVRTPAGHELALVEPVDHLWHRGLWFAIKFVNGVNYWEEREPFGRQQTIGIPAVEATEETVTLTTALDWIGPDGDVPVREERRIRYRGSGDVFAFTWTSAITARVDLELDRTPYTTWGGYGGLSFRGTRTWHIERYLTEAVSDRTLPAGIRAPWADLSGTFDGGPDLAGGILMIDCNAEQRGQTPWYSGGNPSMNFLNAAFLFEGPERLPEGDTLELSYHVVIHDGIWTREDITAAIAAIGDAP